MSRITSADQYRARSSRAASASPWLSHDPDKASARFNYFAPESIDADDFEVTTLGFINVPRGAAYPPPGHPQGYDYRWSEGRTLAEYQIHFISHGTGSIECESTRIAERPVAPGSIFMLFPRVWHRYAPISGTGWSEFWIGLRGRRVEQLIRSRYVSEREPLPALGSVQHILTNFVRAVSTLDSRDPMAPEIRRAATTLILAELNSPSGGRSGVPLSLVERATRYLSDNSAARMSIEDLARHLDVGYHSLRKQFKQKTGCSLQEWRNVLRLREAAQLLKASNLAVKEVAMRCGFDDPYYFSRAFVRHFGVSPIRYRSAKD